MTHDHHDHSHHDHDHDDHHHDDHDHHHGHSHHHHAPASFGKAFAIGIALNSAFVIAEVIYGFYAHSLSLIADAGHNLSDVLGLLLAWSAASLAKRAATERHSYGFGRSSVLAALANAIFLLVSVGGIGWEAIQRLMNPEPINTTIMIVVAFFGVLVNGATALMFMSGRQHDLNLRAAFLHMAMDAVLSLGVVVAGAIIIYTGWLRVDPIMSLILVAVIIYGTWELLRDSLNLALDAVPENIDASAVTQYLRQLPMVTDLHHLHIWGLSTTEAALTVHLVVNDLSAGTQALAEIQHELNEHFHVGHATIQFELASGNCERVVCH
jgi:cobalt-zinc-cadmium efflux system protein